MLFKIFYFILANKKVTYKQLLRKVMTDTTTTIESLKQKIKKFVEERDWQQFHNPKSMSMHITGEAAELMELFTWLSESQSYQIIEVKREAIEQEVADIAFALLNFCHRSGIDLSQAFEKKMIVNAKKYPIEKARGKNTKYTEL